MDERAHSDPQWIQQQMEILEKIRNESSPEIFAKLRRKVKRILIAEVPGQKRPDYYHENKTDHRYEHRCYGDDYITGFGTRESPYTYASAADVSPHYVLIDIWLRVRNSEQRSFVEVNDNIFEVTSMGLISVPGCLFTRLAFEE